jgi:hypothetical protein
MPYAVMRPACRRQGASDDEVAAVGDALKKALADKAGLGPSGQDSRTFTESNLEILEKSYFMGVCGLRQARCAPRWTATR